MFMSAQLASDAAVAPRRRIRPVQLPRPSRRVPWRLALADLTGMTVVAVGLLPRGPAIALTLTWWLLLAASSGYVPRHSPGGLGGVRLAGRIALVMVAACELAGSVVWPDQRVRLLTAVVLDLGWLVSCRVAEWAHWHYRRLKGTCPPRAVVVVGSRPAIARWMAETAPGAGQELVVVAACVVGRHGLGNVIPTVFGTEHIAEAVTTHGADAVLVIPCRAVPPAEIRRLAWRLESTGAELLVAPGLPDVVPRRATLAMAGSVSVLHVRPAALTGARRLVKEVGERTVAMLALLALAPLLIVLVLFVRLDSPGAAIYAQRRVGRAGRIFTMYKLRTMVAGAEGCGAELAPANDCDGVIFKMRADPRITRAGRILRRYSLDELPQLWNVMRGDMALVGPRPALPSEVARYGDDMRRRMVVKPGLTGLWQVSGRSDLPWSKAVQLDLYYVDNWSLGLDIAIVLRTVHAVLGHAGAY